ncbi:MAG: SDR family NAD(P)-dependent oxidoreductase [Bacteroidota bacterium]
MQQKQFLPQHALITGATSGLGLYLMKALYKKGYVVSIICRNSDKTRQILRRYRLDKVRPYIADLTNLTSVKAVTEQLRQQELPIDLIINNAGCLTTGYKVSGEGWEYSMAINYFAPFVLVNNLKPLLDRSPKPLIVNVNSSGHAGQQIQLDHLNEYSGYQAYAVSKLANTLFTIELAAKLGEKMTSIAFDPGPMSTGFGGNLPWWFKQFMQILKPLLPAPRSVAQDLLRILKSEKNKLSNGGYYNRSGLSTYRISAVELSKKEALWQTTTNLLKDYLLVGASK